MKNEIGTYIDKLIFGEINLLFINKSNISIYRLEIEFSINIISHLSIAIATVTNTDKVFAML